PDPRRGVAMSVANVKAAPFLPRDVSVSGLVLDDSTGALEVVVKPGARPVVELAPGVPGLLTATAVPPDPADAASVAAGAARHPVDPVVDALRQLIRTLQGTERWRAELERLKQELAAQRNPLARLGLVESFGRRASADSREVKAAFARFQ